MAERNSVILMLSGGRDSFLSACRLLESSENYKLLMVTYDNGCLVGRDNARTVADRIIEKYGGDRAEYLGVYPIAGIVREFVKDYFNMEPKDQAAKYKGLTPSQFHCLVCRTSMYIVSAWLAKEYGANYIAEGGRADQKFVIELDGMAKDRYPKLVKYAGENLKIPGGLELLLPVYDLKDDWKRDNELLRRGYTSKTFEPKCLLGCPMPTDASQDTIDGVHLFYDNEMKNRIYKEFLTCEAANGVYALKNWNGYD